MRLRLVSIMEVHQVDGLEAQVCLALLELVVQEFGMHTVDARRHILLSDQSILGELLDEHRGTQAIIGIVWHVTVLGRYE